VSSPDRAIHGTNRRLGASWDVPGEKRSGPLPYGPARQAVQFLCAIFVAGQLFGGQHPQSPCLGNRLCPVADAELAVDVACMGLDRVH
jgi:hypothetical protein